MMKKYLVVLLALAMVFAFASTAFAADTAIPEYSDVDEDTAYAEDIYRLTALGVLQGSEGWGHAYRPTESLTRAEFAKIVIYLYGAEDKVAYYAALSSAFSDVAEGYWAEGYINACKDMGLMVGRGDGKFDPTAQVTMQEVATAVLRAVGYTDDLPGAWPMDYINKAADVSNDGGDTTMFSYVDFIGPKYATRAEMAAIANYALDLYQVTYVADQYTLIYGLSGDVDEDGYAYLTWSTNEEAWWDGFEGWNEDGVSLLWSIFQCTSAERQFEAAFESPKLLEAWGWSYEDFEDGELALVFEGRCGLYSIPVASDYFLYMAELWELGAQVADVTVHVTDINWGHHWFDADREVVFAGMNTEVVYTEEETEFWDEDYSNALLYYLDGDEFELYNYEWFSKEDFGIVAAIEDDLVEMHDSTDSPLPMDSEFCLLDDCDVHEEELVILKDGELTDASALEVDDVVYLAGTLAEDFRVVSGDLEEGPIGVYLAYSPVDMTFDALASTRASSITLSGEKYGYDTASEGHTSMVSYDNGGEYDHILYHELHDMLVDDDFDGNGQFVEAYCKGDVATLIFDYEEDTSTYGVITDITYEYRWTNGTELVMDAEPYSTSHDNHAPFEPVVPEIPAFSDIHHFITVVTDVDTTLGFVTAVDYAYYAVREKNVGGVWFYDTITVFQADGEEYTYDIDPSFAVENPDMFEFWFAGPGDLVDFELTDDGDFDLFSINPWTKIWFWPWSMDDDMSTNSRGYFDSDMWDWHYFGGYGNYYITEDTEIFLLTSDEGDFDSVEMGDAADYIGATTWNTQYGIFKTDGDEVTVFYLVDADVDASAQYGLMDGHTTVYGEGEYFLVDGKKVYTAEDLIYTLEDSEVYYVGYKTEGGEIDYVQEDGSYPTPFGRGDLVVLVNEDGYGVDNAEDILADMLDDFEYCDMVPREGDWMTTNLEDDFNWDEDTITYDMTDGGASFDLDDINHTDDDYMYIVIYDDYNYVGMMFRVLD